MTFDEMPPVMREMFRLLPPPDSEWPAAERLRWLRAFEAVCRSTGTTDLDLSLRWPPGMSAEGSGMSGRQVELFPRPPRKPRRVLMHVIDAGDGGGGKIIATFKCKTCGYVSMWLTCDTVTEAKRGLPCPACNPS